MKVVESCQALRFKDGSEEDTNEANDGNKTSNKTS